MQRTERFALNSLLADLHRLLQVHSSTWQQDSDILSQRLTLESSFIVSELSENIRRLVPRPYVARIVLHLAEVAGPSGRIPQAFEAETVSN